ncbi:unnamed protein product [Larinioides sclopetarius]|uniref:Uncharacterized protein n=1 Tax=Larinioides sclopetarius TaxID=280406 RepID=A0AAV2BYC7_9ARAC
MVSQKNGKNMEVSIIPLESAGQETAKIKNMFWHIDREMIRFKLHFFLFEACAGIGCVIAGLGFDSFGGHNTFFFLSVFAGCSMILSIILHLCIRGRKGSIDLTPSQNT